MNRNPACVPHESVLFAPRSRCFLQRYENVKKRSLKPPKISTSWTLADYGLVSADMLGDATRTWPMDRAMIGGNPPRFSFETPSAPTCSSPSPSHSTFPFFARLNEVLFFNALSRQNGASDAAMLGAVISAVDLESSRNDLGMKYCVPGAKEIVSFLVCLHFLLLFFLAKTCS